MHTPLEIKLTLRRKKNHCMLRGISNKDINIVQLPPQWSTSFYKYCNGSGFVMNCGCIKYSMFWTYIEPVNMCCMYAWIYCIYGITLSDIDCKCGKNVCIITQYPGVYSIMWMLNGIKDDLKVAKHQCHKPLNCHILQRMNCVLTPGYHFILPVRVLYYQSVHYLCSC